jgi:hypothetical protein
MPLQLGLCIVHRWLIPPEGKVGTRIRFQTSVWTSTNGERVPMLRTFEATLCDISAQRDLDEGNPQYGFVLDETPDSAAIFSDLRSKYQENCKKVLAEWASDLKILPMVQERLSKPPLFQLQTTAKYIFAEGDRVTVHVPSPNISSISEPLGDIIKLEILD